MLRRHLLGDDRDDDSILDSSPSARSGIHPEHRRLRRRTATGAPKLRPAGEALRLYVFDCGTSRLTRPIPPEGGGGRDDRSVRPVLHGCTSARKADLGPGRCSRRGLDTDWRSSRSSSRAAGFGERDLTLRKPLMAQLSEAGYAAGDITHLAFSHYHYDHTCQRQCIRGCDVARAAGRARRDVRGQAAGRHSAFELCGSEEQQDGDHLERRARRVRRWFRHHEACGRAHARPPGPVRQTAEDRRGGAVRRSLSLPRSPHAEACGDLRLRSGADARVQGSHRGLSRQDRGAAVDLSTIRLATPG